MAKVTVNVSFENLEKLKEAVTKTEKKLEELKETIQELEKIKINVLLT